MLSLALFPQVAPKFLDRRDHPEKYAEPAAAPAAAAPAKAADPTAIHELTVQVGADVLAKL